MSLIDASEKSLWLAALRSGTYKQGTGELRPTDDTYCCIGVYCDVINPSGWRKPHNGHWYHILSEHNGFPDALEIITRLDIQSHFSIGNKLADMNDMKVDFLKIADWIETNL